MVRLLSNDSLIACNVTDDLRVALDCLPNNAFTASKNALFQEIIVGNGPFCAAGILRLNRNMPPAVYIDCLPRYVGRFHQQILYSAGNIIG